MDVLRIQEETTFVGAIDPRKVIEVREEQSRNALSPMAMTLLGMVTVVREEQE